MERNSVWLNDGTGISFSSGTDGSTRISENAVSDNGGSGIVAPPGALVLFNSSRANGGNGLGVSVGAAYGNNNLRSNGGVTITVTGGSIDPNVCDGSLTCP